MNRPPRYRVERVIVDMALDGPAYVAYVQVLKAPQTTLTVGPCITLEELLQQALDVFGYRP